MNRKTCREVKWISALIALFTTISMCFLRPDGCRVWFPSTMSSADDEVGAGLLRRPLATRLLGAVVIAVCLFTLSLPMQRLAELHVFVIVINFIHIVLVCLSTTFFTFFYSERYRKNLKEE
uniref:Uncharacterized protein n=1 Tax=Angiostrongylus cantonensis TaxID=6313 RepID=A0A0K0DG69_ANGCA